MEILYTLNDLVLLLKEGVYGVDLTSVTLIRNRDTLKSLEIYGSSTIPIDLEVTCNYYGDTLTSLFMSSIHPSLRDYIISSQASGAIELSIGQRTVTFQFTLCLSEQRITDLSRHIANSNFHKALIETLNT